jgi:hypothetical protein
MIKYISKKSTTETIEIEREYLMNLWKKESSHIQTNQPLFRKKNIEIAAIADMLPM